MVTGKLLLPKTIGRDIITDLKDTGGLGDTNEF
jgi:hypothetical protein